MSGPDGFRLACLLVGGEYKPGDPAPDGYLAWHEWAEVQHKAGLRQRQCRCGKWRFPQQECCPPVAEAEVHLAAFNAAGGLGVACSPDRTLSPFVTRRKWATCPLCLAATAEEPRP